MPLIKEKRKKRGRKVQLNALGRASQLITIQGNKKAAENIAQVRLQICSSDTTLQLFMSSFYNIT